MRRLKMKLFVLLMIIASHSGFAQADSAFCQGVNTMLSEMQSGFDNIKGDRYAGYQGDEFMATKKLPGAIEARIPEETATLCQNVFLENEPSRELAFAKYEELLAKLKACVSTEWSEKDLTKIQDRERKSYKFTRMVGGITEEIVITTWKQFNGFTLTVRFSKR